MKSETIARLVKRANESLDKDVARGLTASYRNLRDCIIESRRADEATSGSEINFQAPAMKVGYSRKRQQYK